MLASDPAFLPVFEPYHPRNNPKLRAFTDPIGQFAPPADTATAGAGTGAGTGAGVSTGAGTGAARGAQGGLPRTGSDAVPLVRIGAVMLAVGGGLLYVTRRRRAASAS
jgi:LPXTG-motif cell wall-anchored protein